MSTDIFDICERVDLDVEELPQHCIYCGANSICDAQHHCTTECGEDYRIDEETDNDLDFND